MCWCKSVASSVAPKRQLFSVVCVQKSLHLPAETQPCCLISCGVILFLELQTREANIYRKGPSIREAIHTQPGDNSQRCDVHSNVPPANVRACVCVRVCNFFIQIVKKKEKIYCTVYKEVRQEGEFIKYLSFVVLFGKKGVPSVCWI